MLLTSFDLTIVNNHCLPGALSVNAVARLDQNVGPAIPYLNAVLGGSVYVKDLPAVTFQTQGRLISVSPGQITVNGIKDRDQALKIIQWIQREINDAWENRASIIPCHEGKAQPALPQILKHLPGTNCRECREATCMVFALRLSQGAKGIDACPALTQEARQALRDLLAGFSFED